MNNLLSSQCPFPHPAPVQSAASALTTTDIDHYLDTILSTIADGIISINSVGIIQRANSAALTMFGYESQEVIGKNVSMLMPEPYRSRHDSILARKSGQTRPDLFGPVLELQGERKDGSCFDIGMAISILPPGSTSQYVGVIRDITQQKKLDHLRQSLVSVMSHELRTPLTAIIGALSMLKTPELVRLPDQALEFVNMALRHSIRLQKLTQQLLDAEHLTNRAIDIPLASHELGPIIQQALEELHQQATLSAVQLPSAQGGYGHWVWADNFRLKRVITSVLDNAIRYSPRGSRIDLTVSLLDSTKLRLLIRDYGSGISNDLQATIFKQFASSYEDSSALRGGMGLSLPISHGFMQQMQGCIGILSSSPKGSTFYIDLLLAAAEQR